MAFITSAPFSSPLPSLSTALSCPLRTAPSRPANGSFQQHCSSQSQSPTLCSPSPSPSPPTPTPPPPPPTRRTFVHHLLLNISALSLLDHVHISIHPLSSSAQALPSPTVTSSPSSSIYSLSPLKNGQPHSLSTLTGTVTLFVNVASYCALTPQYSALVSLHDTYQPQGFEIIASPCNQFARQEPESNQQICDNVKNTFGARFLLLDKLVVNESPPGDGPVDPLYRALRDQAPQKKGSPIMWNFEKFLVGTDGAVLRRYGPGILPMDIEPDIQYALAHPGAPLPPKPKPYLGVA